jgi:hypothetical protein
MAALLGQEIEHLDQRIDRRRSGGVIAVIRAAVQTSRNGWEWKNVSSIDW